MEPDTVQTVVVLDVKLTANPELLTADIETGATPKTLPANAGNVMS